jgi:hypothetical protein
MLSQRCINRFKLLGVLAVVQTPVYLPARLPFYRCGSASPPVATRRRKTYVAHRRIKIERVYRPYLTALEAEVLVDTGSLPI